MSGLRHLSVAEASSLISTRKLSPVEYVQALLDHADAFEPQICAFATRTSEQALAAAHEAERQIAAGMQRGALHGIPFGIKDVFDTDGVRTTGGSRLCMDNVPSRNATVVQRLLDAGALPMGKLATHEFASGGPSLDLPFPPARNPWNTDYFTGGSSSGPGAAVAAGFVPAALGTDTGGSIRIPGALCGLAALKPTYGLVSRHGVMANSFTFDHVGPLARTAEDCAMLLQAMAGHDAEDPTSAVVDIPDYRGALANDLRGLRIGVVRHFWEEEAPTDPEMCAAMDDAIDVLRRLGASIGVARMRSRREYSDAMMVIAKIETASIYKRDFQQRLHAFGGDFIARTLPGLFFSGEDYVRAQRQRRVMVQQMGPLYAQFDALLTATSTPAARLDRVLGAGAATRWKDPSIYTPFNVSGGPALVVCNGYTGSGMPLAMQIAARPFDEGTVLRIGHAYERATPWRDRRPVLTRGAKVSALCEPAATSAPEIDPRTRARVDIAIERSGITLDDRQRALLYEVGEPALAAASRVADAESRSDEPASAFRFHGSGRSDC